MTKAKPRETEVYNGAGVSANLILIRKKGAGKYHGVQPSGHRFQAFVYKPDKQRNVGIGTYDTPLQAAVAAAVAQKAVKAGVPGYSPEKPRIHTGAAMPTHPMHAHSPADSIPCTTCRCISRSEESPADSSCSLCGSGAHGRGWSAAQSTRSPAHTAS
jgi:hypothetical protein